MHIAERYSGKVFLVRSKSVSLLPSKVFIAAWQTQFFIPNDIVFPFELQTVRISEEHPSRMHICEALSSTFLYSAFYDYTVLVL